jgi:hypothetical protein
LNRTCWRVTCEIGGEFDLFESLTGASSTAEELTIPNGIDAPGLEVGLALPTAPCDEYIPDIAKIVYTSNHVNTTHWCLSRDIPVPRNGLTNAV